MVKKHIIILATLISLIGCSVQDTNKDLENNDSNIVEKNEEKDNNDSASNVEDEKVEDEKVEYDRYQYIEKVFADNNYNPPAQSEWLVKDEGENKVAVIIKVPVSKAKPLITKLIFLEKDVNEIVFLQIENKIIIP